MSFIAPLATGILAVFFSFNAAFILGAVMAILSLIPIVFFHAPPHPTHYDFTKVVKILSKPNLKAVRGANFWESFDYNFAGVAWLLAFTIFIGDILDLSILIAVTTLLAAVASWLVGKWFDGRKRKKALLGTTRFHWATTFLLSTVYFFPHPIYVWLIQFLNELSATASETVTESYLHALSNRVHPVHFHLNREVLISLSGPISAAILAVTFYFLPNDYLWLSIAIGSFFLWGRLSLKRVDHLLH